MSTTTHSISLTESPMIHQHTARLIQLTSNCIKIWWEGLVICDFSYAENVKIASNLLSGFEWPNVLIKLVKIIFNVSYNISQCTTTTTFYSVYSSPSTCLTSDQERSGMKESFCFIKRLKCRAVFDGGQGGLTPARGSWSPRKYCRTSLGGRL